MGITITETRVQDKSSGALNIKDIINIVYPVGSIYMSVNDTDPSLLFHGTWERIKDRFLLASGDTYSAGSTGGEAQHTLTQNEIPNYSIGDIPSVVPGYHDNWSNGGVHSSNMGNASGPKPGVNNNGNEISAGTQWSWRIETNGGSQPHNNMPPYLTVYVWKRIA